VRRSVEAHWSPCPPQPAGFAACKHGRCAFNCKNNVWNTLRNAISITSIQIVSSAPANETKPKPESAGGGGAAEILLRQLCCRACIHLTRLQDYLSQNTFVTCAQLWGTTNANTGHNRGQQPTMSISCSCAATRQRRPREIVFRIRSLRVLKERGVRHTPTQPQALVVPSISAHSSKQIPSNVASQSSSSQTEKT
jgi:hypothetical protein